MSNLLEKIRKLNSFQRTTDIKNFKYKKLADVLSEIFKGNIYIISEDGELLGESLSHKKDEIKLKRDKNKKRFIQAEANAQFLRITSTRINLSGLKARDVFNEKDFPMTKQYLLSPIISKYNTRTGTLIVSRYKPKFESDDIVLIEQGSLISGIYFDEIKQLEIEKQKLDSSDVELALKTLSISELNAMKCIVDDLGDISGELRISKISERIGITRSIIVNALRKLETAGIIESKSNGMRGTFVKPLNDRLIDMLLE